MSTEVGKRRGSSRSARVPLGVALVVFVAIGALCSSLAIEGWRSVYPRWSDVVLLGLGVAPSSNAASSSAR